MATASDEAAVAGWQAMAIKTTGRPRDGSAARRSKERQTFLLTLSDALRPLADPFEVQDAAARVLGEHFGVAWTYYGEADRPPTRMTVKCCYARDGLPSLAGVYPIASWACRAPLESGNPVAVPDMATHPLVSDGTRARFGALGMRSFAAVPIVKSGALRAVIVVADTVARSWTDQEIMLLEEVAERTWAAVEHARAEEALRDSEARFRGFAEASTDTLWIADAATGRLEYLSPAFVRVWGEERDAVLGNIERWTELVHPEDRDQANRAMPRARLGDTVVVEYRIVRPLDGAVRWIRDTGFPIRGDDGQVLHVAGIARDITAQKRAEGAPRASASSLSARVETADAESRRLAHRLLTVQEEERRFLARELHDEIGQVLTGLGLQLGAGTAMDETRLAEARRIVGDLTEQVRQLSMDLRPAALDAYGLLPALQSHITRFARRTGVAVDLRHEGVERRFLAPVEITAYRVVQEALTNVARHADVAAALVQVFADERILTVVIRDRGRGYDPTAPRASGGLSGMRERVELAGGSLSIDAAPGQGVLVTAELPLDGGDRDEEGA